MKTIIVTTDFSPAADNAAEYAAGMASYYHKELLLLHVYEIPVTYGDVPIAANLDEMIKLANEQIGTLKDSLIQKYGKTLNVTTEVSIGSFFDVLEDTCTRIQPYAVVLGSQGGNATEHFLFGSHATHAMTRLSWPIIAVPPHATFHTIDTIGLACEFEDIANTVPVKTISMWVKDFNASQQVLNVSKHLGSDPHSIHEACILKEMLRALNPTYHFIQHPDVDTDVALTDLVKVNKIDLLIALPKKHSTFEKIFKKSHTKQLAFHCEAPVMALHL